MSPAVSVPHAHPGAEAYTVLQLARATHEVITIVAISAENASIFQAVSSSAGIQDAGTGTPTALPDGFPQKMQSHW